MSLSADIAVNDFVDREPKSVLESSKSQAKDGQVVGKSVEEPYTCSSFFLIRGYTL